MGGEKASGWLRVPERIYSQLGEHFRVAGEGGSWNRKKNPPQEAKQGGKGADESEGQ